MRLSLSEKVIVGWAIPINTLGYAIKNRKNPLDVTRFYWHWKLERYEKIVETLEKGYGVEELVEKFMPLVSYRMMIRKAIDRVNRFNKEDYGEWALRFPIDWDLTLNPRHIPRKK